MINHLSAKKMSNQFELAPKSNRLNARRTQGVKINSCNTCGPSFLGKKPFHRLGVSCYKAALVLLSSSKRRRF